MKIATAMRLQRGGVMSDAGLEATALIAVALMWAGCATIDVDSMVLADDADFASMQTFYIVPTVDDGSREALRDRVDEVVDSIFARFPEA